MNVRELLAARSGESLDTYAHGINPQFVKILRTIGFDRQWERTSGQYLFDAAGDRYLDLLGGFGMFNVGRNNPRVREALIQAMELEVPNAIIPSESNYLLNPMHADFRSIRIDDPKPFEFDLRLARA